MDGVQLGARFSLATNRLRYCGPADAEPRLYRAATEGTDLGPARRALAAFEALVPYLEVIGEKHGLEPFDFRVVEAYWVGNELLDPFGPDDFRLLLERLVRRGLPRSLARRLGEHLPARPIPHHAFHVGFVGVGNVTGHVPTTLENMEACRPGWGEVAGVHESSLDVEAPALELVGGTLRLGPARRRELPLDRRLLPEVAVGDRVAFHWNTLALRLDGDQAERLARYTQRSLEATSEAWRSAAG